MPTDVKTLGEYADLLAHLAEQWDDDPPLVLIGDVTGDLSITEQDGHTTFGPVGYAHECFEGNGVGKLANMDTRFFGTMLANPEDLDDDVLDEMDVCRYCHQQYEDCECPEAQEGSA